MKNLLIPLLLCLIAFANACSTNEQADTNNPAPANQKRPETVGNTKGAFLTNETTVSEAPRTGNVKTPSKKDCENIDTGDNPVLKSQTFPIDFQPFEGSCFVTEHNPEYDDPPLGSEIYIYKNGKRIYQFSSRYNPDSATCWVEAVAFEDLNNDSLKDIIVAGKCGAKSGDVQGNEVFINDGKDFYTSVGANDKLDEFSKIKDIANFVRNNQEIFRP